MNTPDAIQELIVKINRFSHDKPFSVKIEDGAYYLHREGQATPPRLLGHSASEAQIALHWFEAGIWLGWRTFSGDNTPPLSHF